MRDFRLQYVSAALETEAALHVYIKYIEFDFKFSKAGTKR